MQKVFILFTFHIFRAINDPQKWNSIGLHTQLSHKYSHGTRDTGSVTTTEHTEVLFFRKCWEFIFYSNNVMPKTWSCLAGIKYFEQFRKLCEKYELFVRLSQSLISFSVSPYSICNLKFKHRCLNVNCQCSVNTFK